MKDPANQAVLGQCCSTSFFFSTNEEQKEYEMCFKFRDLHNP